jgi:diguanylate cyclase (GGDEF)-like protein/PAS domain S-box-containing protein
MIQAASSQHQVKERLRSYRQLLTRLVQSDALSTGDIAAAYRQVTELAVQLLNVERASVWRLDAMNTQLECVDLYEQTPQRHSSGATIRARDVPQYFRALAEERCIAAHDAHTDPRTAEFAESYLQPTGIGAMLDAPIWVAGRMVGVVCHEHVGGARRWDFSEELLAGTVADFVARVIEAADRQRAERVLGEYRAHVQELVGIRAKELERLNAAVKREVSDWPNDRRRELAEVRSMIDSSPVPLVLTRLEDGEVRYVNLRACELFEIAIDQMIGRRAPDFYVEPSDRINFVEQLRAHGRVDGFVAKLKTRSGRAFWALMSAQCIPYQGEDCFMVGFSDVTAQKLAELAVRSSEQNLRAIFAAAPVPLVLSRERDQTVLLANQRAADLFGVPLDEVVGQRSPDYYVNQADRDANVALLMREGRVEDALIRMRKRNAAQFWATLSVRFIDFEGERCFLTGIHDVTIQKELEEQLRGLAMRDPLTGLFNRRHFLEFAEKALHRAERSSMTLALCMFDADHFKTVNDQHGHSIGDGVLTAIARAVEAAVRSSDVVARIGGEEFAVLLPDTDADVAAAVAERIRAAVEALEVKSGERPSVRPTVSVGVAGHVTGDDIEGLLLRADDALYRAKEQGRNRVVQA